MDLTTQITRQIVKQSDFIKVLKWDQYVLVKKDAYKQIPDDKELLKVFDKTEDSSADLNSIDVEYIIDKLIYYYYHFSLNSDLKIKTYFYNSYISLRSEISKNGLDIKDFQLAKEIAMDKQKITNTVLNKISEKINSTGKPQYKEISRLYDQLRSEHTSYGEQIEPVINLLVKKMPIYFY